MKNISLPTLFITLSIIIGCAKEEITIYDGSDVKQTQSIRTSVQYSDIVDYVSRTKTKGELEDTDIEVIVDKDLDTLLFLVNYSEGWELISSYMRTPQVIAKGDYGKIDLSNANPSFLSWLNMTAIDMKNIKSCNDSELTFTDSQIASNILNWNQSSVQASPTGLSLGNWVLTGTDYYNETLSEVPHILTTEWDQSYPYNRYCPTDASGNSYLVGCGGIAAGMLLYYLYTQYNYPETFAGISMNSLLDEYRTDPNETDSVARYLRAINDEMGLTTTVNYWQGGTFTLPSQIVGLFEDLGYSCSYDEYNSNTISSQLMMNKPSIVLSFDEWILNLPAVQEGHYFIIDGYKKERGLTVRHYVYVSDEPFLSMPDREEITYTAPFILQVKMNWGWGDQTGESHDGWYHLTGNWVAGNNSYNTSRHMITNFEYN